MCVVGCEMCLLQIYLPNDTSEYQAFEDEINDAFFQLSPTGFTVLIENFSSYVGTNKDTWKGVIGKHGVTGLMRTEGVYCSSAVATDSALLISFSS